MERLLTDIALTIPSSTLNIPAIKANDTTWSTIVSTAFIAIGAMATLFLLLGAVMYIVSNGDQSAIQRAKNTILYAVVGIVISVLAFTIVQFVLGSLIP